MKPRRLAVLPAMLMAASILAGCAYPYTPPALSPVTQPAPPATGTPAPAPLMR